MARRGWRYIAQRATGDGTHGEILDWDLPLSSPRIESILSGHGSLTGTIDPVYARLIGPDGLPILSEYGTYIWAENDGEIHGGGLLVDSSFAGPSWGIETTSFTGYLVDMPWTGDPAVTNDPPGWSIPAGKDGSGYGVGVDTLDLVRVIWRHVQNQPGSNLGLELDQAKSGLKLGRSLEQVEFDTESGPISFEAGPYKLNWYSNLDLAGDIDKLADATPFDYRERHWWDGDVIRHRLEFGLPRLGRVRDDLRFVFGENIFTDPTIGRSGDDYATEAYVFGAGEGSEMKRGVAKTQSRRGLRKPVVVQKSNIRSQSGVNTQATKELAARKELDEITDIVVVDSPHARLGEVEPGDVIQLQGPASGWREVSMQVRVLGISIEPEAGNQAVYTVTRTDRLAS